MNDPLSAEALGISAHLERVEVGLRDAVQAGSGLIHDAAGHVLSSGGKRFRPMLVLLSGKLADFEPNEKQLVDCAVAIELTHLATLYHDDVMDEASLRRGQPTANARFDNRVAILTGDWLFARASAIAADLGTYPSRVLADTIAAVCEGQIMESEHAGTQAQSIERYLETIKKKTAALIATSCHLGAWLAGADVPVVDAATAYGEAIGMAFQLSDDVLDITGEQERFGKIPGTDLREGVWTLPVLRTLAGSHPGDAALRAALDAGDVEGALGILRENGSPEATLEAAAGWSARAAGFLEAAPPGATRDALAGLAGVVSARTV